MRTLLPTLDAMRRRAEAAVLVTVAATRGSVPREAGAAMVVGAGCCHGTIGGGQLEHRAVAIARELLTRVAAGEALDGVRLVRFPLGASVGQCCGGVVELAFEPLPADAARWCERARQCARAGQGWARISALADGTPARVLTAPELRADTALPATVRDTALALLGGAGDGAAIAAAAPGGRQAWLVTATVAPELRVALFGAGHVGRALVDTLARLPLQLTWVDVREDAFPPALPDNVTAICTDTPEAEVRAMPADSVFLVLTHSHALDFELTRAILERDDFRFFGLIGSRAKRAAFERRLRERGQAAARIARMSCPIGLPGIVGKEPEVIAVAVAAQLMGLRGRRSAGQDDSAATVRDHANDKGWAGAA